jgi:hypothetical protein
MTFPCEVKERLPNKDFQNQKEGKMQKERTKTKNNKVLAV